MTRHTVYATRRLPEPAEERLRQAFDITFNEDDRRLSPDDVVAACEGKDALLINATERLDKGAVARLPATVRAVATYSVGHEHLDLDALGARGIPVVYTPDVLSEAVADTAMLLMLGAARRAREGLELVTAGEWRGWGPRQLIGTHLTGRRLGIFGMGRIGLAVARRAQAFRMTVAYRNRRPLAAGPGRHHTDDAGFLAETEVLVLAAPATAETRHWLNAERIAALPRGALVVNIARGSLVDDEALVAALGSGHVAGAGLDVFDGEPDIHPGYLRLPRAFLQPHIGSSTMETRLEMADLVAAGLTEALNGGTPANRLV